MQLNVATMAFLDFPKSKRKNSNAQGHEVSSSDTYTGYWNGEPFVRLWWFWFLSFLSASYLEHKGSSGDDYRASLHCCGTCPHHRSLNTGTEPQQTWPTTHRHSPFSSSHSWDHQCYENYSHLFLLTKCARQSQLSNSDFLCNFFYKKKKGKIK